MTLSAAGVLPVARAEELLSMKVLSATERRPLDRTDAIGLLATNPDLDVGVVRANLQLITERGFDRGEKLFEKLNEPLAAVAALRT